VPSYCDQTTKTQQLMRVEQRQRPRTTTSSSSSRRRRRHRTERMRSRTRINNRTARTQAATKTDATMETMKKLKILLRMRRTMETEMRKQQTTMRTKNHRMMRQQMM